MPLPHLAVPTHNLFSFLRSYEPALGLVRSPKEFALGLGAGSTSLVRNTLHGAMNTVSKVGGRCVAVYFTGCTR